MSSSSRRPRRVDEEMARRIAAHRESRPATWRTVEAPRDVGRTIQDQLGKSAVVVIDCITLLVSNSLLSVGSEPDAAEAEKCVAREVAEILGVADSAAAAFVIVSGEVGLGLVPAYPVGPALSRPARPGEPGHRGAGGIGGSDGGGDTGRSQGPGGPSLRRRSATLIRPVSDYRGCLPWTFPFRSVR